MSTSLTTLIRLRGIQNKTRHLFNEMSDIDYRLQYHPDLSPMGWYLGYGLFTENYWLHEIIQGDNQFTSDKSLFTPQSSRSSRGPRLPELQALIAGAEQQQDNNDLLLMDKAPPLSEHPLFKDEYIENFIIQNYSKQYEAIFQVLNQKALKKDKGLYTPEHILKPRALVRDITHIPAGKYSVGGELPFSFDNELPAHPIQLNDFYIASTPVTNGEYLRFIEDSGYQNQKLWSQTGWQWCEANNIQQPEHWRQNKNSEYYAVNHLGAYDLINNVSVSGINHYEASAFANWAGARLPHEHEWETAARLELLKKTTEVWEWCNNQLYPYDDFKAFPDNNLTEQPFDSGHYVLKGASPYTRPEIKRASFRNACAPQQRHIFAGLRLVFE